MKRSIHAAAVVLVLAGSGAAARAQQPAAQPAQTPAAKPEQSKLTFDRNTAIWTVAIKPDKTADFERVMERLHAALMNSQNAQRREQARGWRVMRMEQPLPDGTIAYIHMINPVVAGADYTVMQSLYDEVPDERQALYELYRAAFAKNLALMVGDVVVDMSSPAAPQVAAATP